MSKDNSGQGNGHVDPQPNHGKDDKGHGIKGPGGTSHCPQCPKI